jgi:hypothetical protein
MGQPEDYIIEDELKGATSYNSTNTRTKNYTAIKKRNDWRCSFRFRSLFWTRCCLDQNCTDTISFAGFGTGILAYIILWIVPEAITTSEKLEMTGEPVTISNIERKVKRNLKMFRIN